MDDMQIVFSASCCCYQETTLKSTERPSVDSDSPGSDGIEAVGSHTRKLYYRKDDRAMRAI